MACSLLTRILPGKQASRATHGTSQPTTNRSYRQTNSSLAAVKLRSLSKIKSIMSYMKKDSILSVVMFDFPMWIDLSRLKSFLSTLPNVRQIQRRKSPHDTRRFDLVIDFEVGTNAFDALGITKADPYITIDHTQFKVHEVSDKLYLHDLQLIAVSQRTTSETASRSVLTFNKFEANQVECHICRGDIDGPFSTPCWTCKHAQCYDCIKRHFRQAMQDFECFPARCCEHVFHPDVAKAILPDSELAKYKTRFQEWLTKQPVYCPITTCSAFLPPQMLRQLKGKDFECPECSKSLCSECHQQSHLGKKCAQKHGDTEAQEMLKKFGYKQCPKCGIAVAKMYGCSHVQCNCGAHWCWQCLRKIEICMMEPCDDDDFDNDDDQYWREAESDIDPASGSEDENDDPAEPSTSLSEDVTRSATDAHHVVMLPSSPLVKASQEKDGEDVQNLDVTAESGRVSVEIMVTTSVLGLLPAETSTDQVTLASVHETNLGPDQTSENPSHQGTNSTTTIEAANTVDIQNIAETNSDEFVNLDDPRQKAWEHEGLDFGAEPADEDRVDIWGCAHNFQPATYIQVPKYWMTASAPDWWDRPSDNREVDCMSCWRPTKMAPRSADIQLLADGVESRRRLRDWRFARRCSKCNIIVCRKCRNDLIRTDG